MRIAILDFCTPDPVFDRLGSIGEITERWIAPALPEASFAPIHVAGGAPLPAPGAFDGFILSGSEKGVYDDTPWMAPLRRFLTEARAAARPLFGICFGHQIMADAFGGRAEKADKGFVIGARRFEVEGRSLTAHVAHRDQVVAPPPGARVVGAAPYCPIAALEYDFPARSIQFHPEYPAELIAEGIEAFEGDFLTPADAEAGRKSMRDADVPTDLYAAEAAAFFRRTIGGAASAA